MLKPSLVLLNLVLLVLVLASAVFVFSKKTEEVSLEVVFLDVGQGDAILLQEGSWQVLIDGGKSGKEVLSRLGHYIPFWDRHLDVVLATHPDGDHIGGLPSVLRSYRPGLVLTNGDTSDTDISRNFEALIEKESKKEVIAKGTEVVFPSGAKLTVLYPERPLSPETTTESNEGSIVARLTFGETDFLLTGDLAEEERMLGYVEPVEVLKVAHHGSRFSTSDVFLDMIKPTEAVISVGENSYGHPAAGVMENLHERGVGIFRTDEKGDVVYECFLELKKCTRVE